MPVTRMARVRVAVLGPAALGLIALVGAALISSPARAQTMGLATMQPGTLNHTTGTAIAKVAKEKAGLNALVQPTAGESVIIPLGGRGEAEFGIANALEVSVALVSEIEKEFSARRLDATLGLGQIVDLKAEMIGANRVLGILQVIPLGAGEIQQRHVDDAVAHVDGRADFDGFATHNLHLEHVFVKFRGLLEVFDADGDVAQACHCNLPWGLMGRA